MDPSPFNVTLAVAISGRSVTATVTFTNRGTVDAFLYEVNAIPEGRLEKNVFDIRREGQRVEYTGILAKRAQPTPEDFLTVKPGQTYTTVVPLHKFYAFPSGMGEYVARYEAFNQKPAGGVTKLVSNEVAFTLA
jgi:hypothetical protein